MAELSAVVTTVHRDGRDAIESEVSVATLSELYRVCREAPPSALVRVAIHGEAGVVRLEFGAYIRDGAEG